MVKLTSAEKKEFLYSFADGQCNKTEKEVLNGIKGIVKKGSAVERIMIDLLTNDFERENSGYFCSNLADSIYTGAQVNALYNAVINYIELKEHAELIKESRQTEIEILALLEDQEGEPVNWGRVVSRLRTKTIEKGSDCGRFITVKMGGFLFRVNDGAHNLYTVEVISRSSEEPAPETATVNTINTSIKQVPAVFNQVDFSDDIDFILNYGCGKYPELVRDKFEPDLVVQSYEPNWQREKFIEDIDLFVYTTERELYHIASYFEGKAAVVAANVLNVLTNDILPVVVEQITNIVNAGNVAHISIYEGDKTGTGKPTSKGYQRNQRTSEYINLFAGLEVTRKGNILTLRAKNGLYLINEDY